MDDASRPTGGEGKTAGFNEISINDAVADRGAGGEAASNGESICDLSVAVVNWNTREMLADCLATVLAACEGTTLLQGSAPHPLQYEVVVVDNASSDGSAEMVAERFPDVRLIRNAENTGFSKANNQAIRSSRGRYALLLNTDAFIDAASLQPLLRLMEAHPEIGVSGPRLVYPDGSPQVSHSPLPTLTSEVLSLFGLDKRLPQRHGKPKPGGEGLAEYIETGSVEGASLLARREALEQVGLMDESFFFFSEEVDLCARILKAGWKVVYVPDTRVLHVRGGSTGVTARRISLLYMAKLKYFGKHGAPGEREKLLSAMRAAVRVKRLLYSILGVFSKGKRDRAALWAEVERLLAVRAAPHPPEAQAPTSGA